MAAELTKRDYARMKSHERHELSVEALENLLLSTQEFRKLDKEGNERAEILQPVSVFLKWIENEAKSIVKTTKNEGPEGEEVEVSFDHLLTKEEAEKQLLFFQERYTSLYNILNIVMVYLNNRANLLTTYKEKALKGIQQHKSDLIAALDLYHEQFINRINEYLQNEPYKQYRNKAITPFVPDAIDLPLSLLTLTPLQMSILRIYFHDLRILIGTPNNELLLELSPTSPNRGLETHKKLLSKMQSKLADLLAFHDQFDFDTLSYRFTISSLHKFKGAASEHYKSNENASPKPEFIYSIDDRTKPTLSRLLQKETGDPKAKAIIDAYHSYLSQSFLVSVFYNSEQNFRRVNAKLEEIGDNRRITAAKATIDCELRDKPPEGFVDEQFTVTGDDGEPKGVWVTFTLEDNGPGFPKNPGDNEYFEGEVLVREFTPQQDVSTHGGNGIGLAIMKQNVENAKGVFKTYTRQNSGASLSISFPLLQRPYDDEFAF